MATSELREKIDNLPDDLIPDVLDYIDFLLRKYGSKEKKQNNRRKHFHFDWEGGLSKFKKQYSSVELQHKALEWR